MELVDGDKSKGATVTLETDLDSDLKQFVWNFYHCKYN